MLLVPFGVGQSLDVRFELTSDLIHTLIVFPNSGHDLRMRGLI